MVKVDRMAKERTPSKAVRDILFTVGYLWLESHFGELILCFEPAPKGGEKTQDCTNTIGVRALIPGRMEKTVSGEGKLAVCIKNCQQILLENGSYFEHLRYSKCSDS